MADIGIIEESSPYVRVVHGLNEKGKKQTNENPGYHLLDKPITVPLSVNCPLQWSQSF